LKDERHYAGVVVATAPEHLETCAQALDAISGVEVHQQDPSTGRIVLVQEADTVEEQQRLLEQVRRQPNVRFAAVVYHYVDSEETA
jgi:nitrate reductase NapD